MWTKKDSALFVGIRGPLTAQGMMQMWKEAIPSLLTAPHRLGGEQITTSEHRKRSCQSLKTR